MAKNEETADLPEEDVEVKTEEVEVAEEAKADETEEAKKDEAEEVETKADMDEEDEENPEESDEEEDEEEKTEEKSDKKLVVEDVEDVEVKHVVPLVAEEPTVAESVAPVTTEPAAPVEVGTVEKAGYEEEKPESPLEVDEEEKERVDPRLARRAALLRELAELNRSIQSGSTPEDDEMAMRRKRRDEFLARMGMKTEEIAELDDDAIYCAVEGKALSTSDPCSFCRGGCVKEAELPSLLDVAMAAEAEMKAEVLDLGYSADSNMFVVDLKRHDGSTIEAFYTGEGKSAGWVLLDQEMVAAAELEGKDALGPRKIVSITEAEQIALKSIEGEAMGSVPSIFEGYDAYAVEIDSVDGKSYDVYVGLEGEVLGYDQYGDEPSEEEIKALEEQIATAEPLDLEEKRDFSAEERESAAEEGYALPDGSFPIKTEEDLKNAISAFGRAKDKAAAKAHIIKRAKALGKESLIPDSWKATKADGVEDVEDKDDSMLAALMEFQLLNEEIDGL